MISATYVDRLRIACSFVQEKIVTRPDIGIVLGSGLGSFGDELVDPIKIPYGEIPEMLSTTVEGHSGCLIYGKIGNRNVLCLSGRSHQYEGLHPHETQFAVRLLGLIGCRLIILTNAAGTRDPDLNVGDLAPLHDHLNFTHRGYTEEFFQFKEFDHLLQHDMYDRDALKTAHDVAVELKLQTKPTNYVYNMGPVYETKADVEGQYIMGGTNFGMSTVGCVIACKTLGVPVLAMSFVTNKAAGVTGQPLTHEEVKEAVKAGEPNMKALISQTILRVPLKDFPIPQISGDDRKMIRAAPSEFVEGSKYASLFKNVKVDSLVILAGLHDLKLDSVALTIKCADLPEFPLMLQKDAFIEIGVLDGKNVAVVKGLNDLCGFEQWALYYLISMFSALGAKVYVQSFNTASLDGKQGVKVVEDSIPLFERVVVEPKVFNLEKQMTLEGVEKCVLGTYHGPEFASDAEAHAMNVIGCTEYSLGTSHGLMIAKAFNMKSYGVADSAIDTTKQSIEQVLDGIKARKADVEGVVKNIVNTIQAEGSLQNAEFTPVDQKAKQWNDIESFVLNSQEDPEEVRKAAEALPENVQKAFLFEKKEHFSNIPTEAVSDNVFIGTVKGERVLFVVSTRLLVRALAYKDIKIIAIGIALSASEKSKGKQVVCIKDHMNITGISPLVGYNKCGLRFPDQGHNYATVEGFEALDSFLVPDLRHVGPAYLKAMEKLQSDLAVQFGVVEATVAMHQNSLKVPVKPAIQHICVIQDCPCAPFQVGMDLLEKL